MVITETGGNEKVVLGRMFGMPILGTVSSDGDKEWKMRFVSGILPETTVVVTGTWVTGEVCTGELSIVYFPNRLFLN